MKTSAPLILPARRVPLELEPGERPPPGDASFELLFYLPPGCARRRVVDEARAKLLRQTVELGFEPLAETVFLLWLTDDRGRITVRGAALRPIVEASEVRAAGRDGRWDPFGNRPELPGLLGRRRRRG